MRAELIARNQDIGSGSRLVRTNPVKAALLAGKVVLGSEISRLRSPEVARVFAAAGFDFVFIDMEHTPFGLETVAGMIQAARGAGIVPIVRIPQCEYVWVSRVLDNGAQGIIAPRVNTPQQAADLVSWTRYPPRGVRGFACTPAMTDWQKAEPHQFIESVHEHTLVVIQIERREALDNLDAMLAVRDLGVACLGYMDLSVDMGIPGQMQHPSMVEAIERLLESARRNGIAPGIISPDREVLEHWMRRGMKFVSHATDAILLEEAARAAVARLRLFSS
jgi:2-dehydro-3-deoxyglucarate aldolase/4-hydroxy-2-oxoheptanedioate aldolase